MTKYLKYILLILLFLFLYIIIQVSLHEFGHSLTCIIVGNKVTNLNILRIKIISVGKEPSDEYIKNTIGYVKCPRKRDVHGKFIYKDVEDALIKMSGFLLTAFVNLFLGVPLVLFNYKIGFLFLYYDVVIYTISGEFVEGLKILTPDYNIIISIIIFIFILSINIFAIFHFSKKYLSSISPITLLC